MKGFYVASCLAAAMRLDREARDCVPGSDAQAQRYEWRNAQVMSALGTARTDGIVAGVRFDPAEPEWPVVVFELPTGQVSFHVPQHAVEWDGHSKDDVEDRVRKFCEAVEFPYNGGVL